MKKRILSIALASLAVLTVSSTAFAAEPDGNCQPNTECSAQGKHKCKKHKKDGQRQHNCQGADSAACNPFAGLNLTAEQTEALKAIPTPAQVMKEAKKQKSDSQVDRREMMQTVRANYLAQVKQVLTPEQYVQFLENSYVKQMPMKGKKDKKDGQQPKGKKGKKGKKSGERRGDRQSESPRS